MISTTVIPRICKIIEGGALDVYSGRHIRRIIDLIEEVDASVEEGNVKLQASACMFIDGCSSSIPIIEPTQIYHGSIP
jgi:hypothetical protein